MKDIHSNSKPFAYSFEFWCCYLSNFLLMVATSSLFRYADFVTVLDGNEWHLGWIVGIGATGAVAVRVFQGIGMDRYGAGKIWVVSLIVVAVSLLTHIWIDRIGPTVFTARTMYAAGMSGCFGASITFVSIRAPVGRTAEMIGALGSSGFIGMAIGPALADYLLSGGMITKSDVNRLFIVADVGILLSLFSASIAIWRSPDTYTPTRRHPPFWKIIRKYNPGRVLYIGFAMGLAFGIPFTFVRTFADSIGVERIRGYFLVYAITAFVVRVFSRKLPDRWGVRPTVILGAFCLSCSILSFLLASNEWTLLIPGFFGGLAHAFVFPAAVAGGSLTFPDRYRGLATTQMLMMFDIGTVVGQPTVATIWELARQFGLPAYPTVFVSVALILASVAMFYRLESTSSTDRVIERSRLPISSGISHE